MNVQLINTLSETFSDNAPFKLVAAGAVKGRMGDSFVKKDYRRLLVEFVVSGAGFLNVNDEIYELGAGDCYWITPGSNCEYHSKNVDPWFKKFFIADGELIHPILTAFGMNRPSLVRNADVGDIFERILQLSECDLPNVHEQAGLSFHELALKLRPRVETHDNVPEPIMQIKRYMDNHFEKKLTINELAAKINVGKGHVIRNFKRHVGTTPYEYLLNRRIDKAKVLLRNTSLTIGEIADRLSFVDQYYFSNFFKKRTKKSPSAYRIEDRKKTP